MAVRDGIARHQIGNLNNHGPSKGGGGYTGITGTKAPGTNVGGSAGKMPDGFGRDNAQGMSKGAISQSRGAGKSSLQNTRKGGDGLGGHVGYGGSTGGVKTPGNATGKMGSKMTGDGYGRRKANMK